MKYEDLINQIIDFGKYKGKTWDEVAKHKSRDDIWMVIENKVYNVTKFLDEVGER